MDPIAAKDSFYLLDYKNHKQKKSSLLQDQQADYVFKIILSDFIDLERVLDKFQSFIVQKMTSQAQKEKTHSRRD